MKKGIYSYVQKSALASQEERQIQLQQMKADQLKQKQQQLEANLLLLKHNDRQCMNLINKISLSPQHQSNLQHVSNKAYQITGTFQKYQSQKRKDLGNEMTDLQLKEDLQHQKTNLFIVDSEARNLNIYEQFLSSKVDFYQKEHDKIKHQLQTISQKLHKRQRQTTVQLSEKVSALIEQINVQFPSQLSPEDIRQLQKMEFNSFYHSSNSEININKKNIDNLKMQIMCLKNKYYKIDLQLKGKEQLQQELYKNEMQNRRLNQQLIEITSQNNHLETNMEQEVNRVVNEKIQLINFDSYSHVNKYLQASEYLLQKFGQILQKEEMEETRGLLSRIKDSAEIKYNQRP